MNLPTMSEKLEMLLTSLGLTLRDLTPKEYLTMVWLADTADWRSFYQLNSVFEKAKLKDRGE